MDLNERGSTSLVAILFFMAFIAIIFSNMARSYEELQIIKYYNKSYICSKKVIVEYKSFYKRISYINVGLKSIFYAQFFPLAAWLKPFMKYGAKGLQYMQSALRYFLRFKLLTIDECEATNILALLRTDPLGSKLWKIRRRLDTSAVFEKKWKAFMPFHYTGSNLSENHSFVITLKFKLEEGRLLDDFTLSSKHMAPKGIQQLKDYYGLQFL
ncbi:hypothetical protein ABMA70_14690 [Halobacteriovorax sp. XZX-3]|uniref:hypothetical protein n=2 Tax=unclassified Halobacteriovorax TaxID=2639665 RepID=UPI000CD13DB4|nr:hypothetical protein [Halobacteriovorax sp. DA5]POB13662.1 hypothetical protein C0Z22_08905 [Halobacteriovorax sp. DA5]